MSTSAAGLPLTMPVLGYGFTNAFPGLKFDRPVVITTPNGETNRLFIAEKSGRIWAINDLTHPVRSLFLDLSESTYVSTEAGLLGLTFHPNFHQNGRFFVYRIASSTNGFRDELLEFRCNPPIVGGTVDPASQKTLLSQLDASDTHNAGNLKFGPDGYLYLSLGETGPVYPDTHETPQAIDKGFFGGIIRIDVDLKPDNLLPNYHPAIRGEYRIPKDNPFIGLTSFNGLPVEPSKVRNEFFAVGMRNPWRFTFDSLTDELISGDVGEGSVEEINIVKKGGNYGWPYMEGSLVALPGPLPADLQLPAYEYPHGDGLFEGRAIIGGEVYYGSKFPALNGMYLFGDYGRGTIWAIDLKSPVRTPVWIAARVGLSSFGVDPVDGGVLLANHFAGTIERLVYTDPASAPVPRSLRDVNAFTDLKTLTPTNSLFAYDVASPLWSDGAYKQRWVDLSRAVDKIHFDESNNWTFPAGTVFFKHFELELTNGVPASRRRVETRVLVKTSDDLYGLTYRWGDSLTNAYLAPPEGTNDTFIIHDGGILRTQVWNYPTWDQCRFCHNQQSGYILGFRTEQLNKSIAVGAQSTNQLAFLAAHGIFDQSTFHPSQLRALAPLDDPIAPLQHRVRSYLEGNCLQCHQPGAFSGAAWDARIATPLAQANILNAPANFYPAPAKIIAPGDLIDSYMLFRVSNRVPLFQMPPLASTVVDDQFVSTLTNWISTIPGSDWQRGDIGSPLVEGSAEVDSDSIRISSAGSGLAADSYYFCGRIAFGTSALSARLIDLTSLSSAAEGGLMIRQSMDPQAPAVALVRQGKDINLLARRVSGEPMQKLWSAPLFLLGSRMKLITDGSSASVWISDNQDQWRQAGFTQVALGSSYLAGFVAASGGEASQFATAKFSEVKLSSVGMGGPSKPDLTLPARVTLTAVTSLFGETNGSVAFRNGNQPIGPVLSAPWAYVWSNPPAGDSPITALLQTSSGMLTSSPVVFHASAPATAVWLRPLDRRTSGDWSSQYGADGYLIPGFTNVPGASVRLNIEQGDETVIGTTTNRSSLRAEAAGIASEIQSSQWVELNFRSQDFGLHQIELYFRDWLNAGKTQTVEFLNPADDSLLDRRLVSAAPPAYLRFVFQDQVTVRVRNTNGPAYVTGIFIDPVPAITLDIASPEDGTTLDQPVNIPVTVTATAPTNSLQRVELWDGNAQVANFSRPPFSIVLTNVLAGEHALRAVAYSTFGTTAESDPVTLEVSPIESGAQFLGVDSGTHGFWKGRYGQGGWFLPGDSTQLSPAVQVSSQDGLFFSFADFSTEEGAVERSTFDGQFAACLYGVPEFSMNLNFLDGQPWTAALYFLDWGDTHRDIAVSVEAPDGTVLDREEVTDFAAGKYLLWKAQGALRFRLVSKSINAVVSGVFVDAPFTAYDLWLRNEFSPVELPAPEGNGDSGDFDGDGFSNALEYYLGYDPRSAADKPQFDSIQSGGSFRITFTQRAAPADMTLRIDSSTDLLHWTEVTPTVVSQAIADGNRVTLTFPALQTRQFIRYAVVPRSAN